MSAHKRSRPMPSAKPTQLLSVAELAGLLGMSERAIRRKVDRRMLPFRKWGARVLFVRSEIDTFFGGLPGTRIDEARATEQLFRS